MPIMTPQFKRVLDQINNVKAKDLLITSRYKNVIIAADFALDLEKALKPTIDQFNDILNGLRDQNHELIDEKEILNEQLSKQGKTLKEQQKTIKELEKIIQVFG